MVFGEKGTVAMEYAASLDTRSWNGKTSAAFSVWRRWSEGESLPNYCPSYSDYLSTTLFF
jgi:hypothetical protein